MDVEIYWARCLPFFFNFNIEDACEYDEFIAQTNSHFHVVMDLSSNICYTARQNSSFLFIKTYSCHQKDRAYY